METRASDSRRKEEMVVKVTESPSSVALPYHKKTKMASSKPFVPALDAQNGDPDKDTIYDFPRDLVGYGRHPSHPHWPGDAKIAVSFVINYEEVPPPLTFPPFPPLTPLTHPQGAERSVLNGDAQSESSLHEQSGDRPGRIGERAINVESDYEYGSRVGIWRLLNLFEAHKMPITCFAVGQALEKNPEVAMALMSGGHEVASHAYRWIDYHGKLSFLWFVETRGGLMRV